LLAEGIAAAYRTSERCGLEGGQPPYSVAAFTRGALRCARDPKTGAQSIVAQGGLLSGIRSVEVFGV
jgi:hypothetical protein